MEKEHLTFADLKKQVVDLLLEYAQQEDVMDVCLHCSMGGDRGEITFDLTLA